MSIVGGKLRSKVSIANHCLSVIVVHVTINNSGTELLLPPILQGHEDEYCCDAFRSDLALKRSNHLTLQTRSFTLCIVNSLGIFYARVITFM